MGTATASAKTSIFDLLTDPSDALDILQALDLPTDFYDEIESPVVALQTFLTSYDESRVFFALTTFATKFAYMVEEISSFFKYHKVSPNAQLHLAGNTLNFAFDAFNASWAGRLDGLWSKDIQEQSEAIATAVAGLLEQLRYEDFVRIDRASLGRRVTGPMKSGKQKSPTSTDQRDVLSEVCSEGDYNAIKFATMACEEVLHDLGRRHLSTVLQAAFEEISTACSSLLRRMELLQMVKVDAHPAVATLSDDIYLCAMQARSLAARVAEAERAEDGLGDFIRSSFWKHRWRVYEIWLLTKTISTLALHGGEASLHGISGGVWLLPYGQSDTPVASIRFGEKALQIFYQFIDKTGGSADMPDILVSDGNDKAIIVVDPKHGRTYNRSKVQPVLARYHRRFKASFTAIVNYYSIRSYPYELVFGPSHTWLLASNVAPGTNESRRFEYQIADIGCALGYFRDSSKKPISQPKKWSPSAAGIIYWATGAREVDEPSGAWCYTRERGAHPLLRLQEIMDKKVEEIAATDDGRTCAFRAVKELILVSAKLENPLIVIRFSDLIECMAWEPAGSNLLVKSGDMFSVVDSSGEIQRTVESPTQHFEPIVAWIGTTGAILYAQQLSLSQVIVYRFVPKNGWTQILDFPVPRVTFVEMRIIRYPRHDAVVLQLTPVNSFLVALDSIAELSKEQRAFVSVSPSGRYTVEPGPLSLRAADGISLLKVTEVGKDDSRFPLIRFIGELASSIIWNLDETAFGFFAHRRFRSGADDIRVSTAAVGDRDAITMSLPSQAPRGFAWLNGELIRELEKI